MLAELGRIASHLVFYACFGGDLGGQTALLFGFKEREMIHDILDEVTGSRLTTNFFRPGGSVHDVPETFIPRVTSFLKHLEKTMVDYERFLSKNIIVWKEQRNRHPSKEDAIAYGCSGPVLEIGCFYDVRKNDPYGIYISTRFNVPVTYNGDTNDRYGGSYCRNSRIHKNP
jgi:NADH-quinone oxidoreductase subunit D